MVCPFGVLVDWNVYRNGSKHAGVGKVRLLVLAIAKWLVLGVAATT
tara:strand:+ start:637 stop:774 length:138 start_codon:yes stop_codon:yes gene_type:complete